MRGLICAAAVVALGVVELALGWRVAIMGVAPDLLFAAALLVTARLQARTRAPVACAMGALSDLLVGERLGLMALGYCLGAALAARFRQVSLPPSELPAAGGRAGKWLLFRKAVSHAAAETFVIAFLALAGAFAAHAVAAVVGGVLDGGAGAIARRLALAAGIASYTAAVTPLIEFILGPLFAFAVAKKPLYLAAGED